MIVTLLAALLQTPNTSPAVLMPLDKWSVDYGNTGCSLARSFGDEAAPVTLRFTPASLGGFTTIMLDAPAGNARQRQAGTAMLQFQPENRTLTADYMSPEQRDENHRAVAIRLIGQEIGVWRGVERLAISLDKSPPLTVELKGMHTAISALQKCQDDLLRDWQVDPGEVSNMAVNPKLVSDLGEIFDPKYLRNGLPKGELLRVNMLFTVGIDGSVSACRVIETSGQDALDTATCALSIGRIRYRPARDKSDRPMVSHAVLAVRWPSPPE